ncbi:ABC transporter ATP-binding protein [Thiohalocapsa sp.]|uniref:ABC transporter ATP-binding protein n=1 Tax=Thiohalocapsa sp. TaxID=2497641 RepID=UPI0025D92E89|nr:ABC transporter ATP-binding protein [Thiohalocapsa sp.]
MPPAQDATVAMPIDTATSQLSVLDASVAYGDTTVVSDVSFVLEAGNIGCLLGPSGCGKPPRRGAMAGAGPRGRGGSRVPGELGARPGDTLAPGQRRMGMVFQAFALFPPLDVGRNIAFGLRGQPAAMRRRRVGELLELVGLTSAARQYPHELSGGMQQRVALARAMAPRPQMLLLDEPFSSMDADMREQIAREVRDVLKRENVTAILVTHDQLEAFAMADIIGVIGGGRVHQWGSGFSLYHEPADRFVADFIGQGVLLPATVHDEIRVKTELGRIAGEHPHGLERDTPAEVLIRPDDMVYDESSPRKAVIVERAFRGAEFMYTVRLASGTEVLCLVPSHYRHAVGEEIGVRLQADHLVVFPVQE